MRTNIFIDDDLMAEAMEALGAKTKREAVEWSGEMGARIAWVFCVCRNLGGNCVRGEVQM